jgi:hypothetical protein
MARLIVRGLDEATIAALKARAARNGRSAEAEHRRKLEAALRGCRHGRVRPGGGPPAGALPVEARQHRGHPRRARRARPMNRAVACVRSLPLSDIGSA